jgi:hypothetical protein
MPTKPTRSTTCARCSPPGHDSIDEGSRSGCPWGPVVWVMIPEVLPLSVRGTAMGVAVFCNCLDTLLSDA